MGLSRTPLAAHQLSPGHHLIKPSAWASVGRSDVGDFFKNPSNTELVILPDRRGTGAQAVEHLQGIVPRDRFVQLGYMATPDQVTFAPRTTNLVQMSNFTSLDQARELVARDYSTVFVDAYDHYVGENLGTAILDAIKGTVSLEQSVAFVMGGEIVAMVYCYDSADCTQEKVHQVGYVWIDNNAPKEARVEIRSLIGQWLKDNFTMKFQAGIHLYNLSSQKFFESLGFKLTCAHVLRRS